MTPVQKIKVLQPVPIDSLPPFFNPLPLLQENPSLDIKVQKPTLNKPKHKQA